MKTSTNSQQKVLVKIFFLLILILINSTGNTRTTSRNSGSQPSLGIVGSWVATYTCNNTEVYGLLAINKSSSTLKIIGSNNLAVLKFEKPNIQNSKSIELIADTWLYKPDDRSRNFQSIDINATISDSGLVLNGKIKGQPSCTNFIAYKYKTYGKNDVTKGKIKLKKKWNSGIKMPVIKIKFNGRKHDLFGKKNKTVDNKQCIYLFEWQSKNRVKTIGNRQRFTIDSVVSNDDSMFNVFGKTYDNWTSDDATAYTKMFNDCRKQLSRSAKTNASKLLYASSNRRPLKSLSYGIGNKKISRRIKVKNNYQKYTSWILYYYSIASARAANTYTTTKIKNLLDQQSKNKYAQTIKTIRNNRGIMRFLSDSKKISYIQQLGGAKNLIVNNQSSNKTQTKKTRRQYNTPKPNKKCGSGKCGDGKCGTVKPKKKPQVKKITKTKKQNNSSENDTLATRIYNNMLISTNADIMANINAICILSKESCLKHCKKSPEACPGGTKAAFKRGLLKSCSDKKWQGKNCLEVERVYGRLDQNIPIVIPSQYKELYKKLENGKPFKMTEENLVVVSGIGEILVNKCSLLIGKQKKIADEFIKSGSILATMGNSYMDINLAKNIKLAKLFRTGMNIGENIACRLPQSYSLAINMVKSIESNNKVNKVDNQKFVNSCSYSYSKKQCECLANLGQSVIPNIRQLSYGRDIMQRIMRGNPLVALAIPFKCGINKY